MIDFVYDKNNNRSNNDISFLKDLANDASAINEDLAQYCKTWLSSVEEQFGSTARTSLEPILLS